MCGIAGLWSTSAAVDAAGIAGLMGSQLAHRGPDDSGLWSDPEMGLALAHRRLSILDLSPEGRQPMISRGRRYVIVYNGELYNHVELREALGAVAWRGHSDTEVLLEAIDRWGLESALQRCVGMFALALWDRKERCLTLARDRLGEKPLYYGQLDHALVFASELKALRVRPQWRSEIDRHALALYLQYGAVPAPHSIYRGISKLAPGMMVRFGSPGDTAIAKPYWSAEQSARQGRDSPVTMSEAKFCRALQSSPEKVAAPQPGDSPGDA